MSEKPPAQATCPRCGTLCEKPKALIKEWNCTPNRKTGEIEVWIHYWCCPLCHNRFRTATRVWIKPQKKPRWKLPLTSSRGSTDV